VSSAKADRGEPSLGHTYAEASQVDTETSDPKPSRNALGSLRAIAIISTFIYTGIRLQELLNLNIEDVRFEDRSLLVRSGKGNKDRLIPLEDALIRILEAYLKDRDRVNREHPRLFVSLTSDRPMRYKAIQRLVEKLREKSGIHFSPHMLRHTFATLMLEGGVDIYALSNMMGHSDIKIKTTTIYLTATAAHLHKEIIKHPLGATKVLSRGNYV